jgi:hypothetical protein
MRRSRLLPAAWLLATATALASGVTGPEPLTYRGVTATRDGGRIRASFDAPEDTDAQDLRGDPVSIRVGSDAAVVFGDEIAPLRVTKNGAVARFKAGRRDAMRVRKFKLSPAKGTFDVSLGGGRLDPSAPPPIELSFAGRVYRWPHPTSGYPSPPPYPLPDPAPAPLADGPLAFTDVARMSTEVAPTVVDAVLRNSTEADRFTSRFSFGGGAPAAFSQVDFTKEMIVVAVGDNTGYGILPWSVRIAGVQVQGGRVVVSYDKYWGPICCSRSLDDPVGGPPYAAYFHAVKVPMTSAPVDFVATPVKTQTPWD